jgi:hypothetical protein
LSNAESERANKWIAAAVIAMIGGGVLVAMWSLADDPAAPSSATSDEAAFRAFEASEPAAKQGAEGEPERDAGGEEPTPDARRFQGTIVRPPPLEPSASSGSQTDAGSSADVRLWQDPVNQRVLGQKKWMAQLPDAASQEIDEELEKERPQRYPIDLTVRRSGVDVAKEIVEGCYERLLERNPQADGRLAVGFNMVADGSTARFKDVDVLVKVRLYDPAFDDCIIDELSRASFPTSEEGVMWVEYPFVFEEGW